MVFTSVDVVWALGGSPSVTHGISVRTHAKTGLGSLGGRDLIVFVKRAFVQRSCRVKFVVEKSFNTYIEWFYPNTKRMDFVSRYEHTTTTTS